MKIGFIGLGIMGEAMAANIVKKHDDTVLVSDVVPEKVAALTALGAVGCESNLELAEKVDFIISMVPKSEHVTAVCEGILPALGPGKIWVDMSTIDPSVSVEIGRKVKATGAVFADAPVVKSRPAAEAGKLGIYVGCDEADYEKIQPVMAYMGENIIRMGGNGKGLVMKICHNAMVSQIQNGVNETLALAELNDIDVDTFVTAVSYGGAFNWYLDSKKAVLKSGDYTTAFSAENMNKDIGICLRLAESVGLSMPGEKNAQEVYRRTLEAGNGRKDFSVTFETVKAGRTPESQIAESRYAAGENHE